MRDLQKIYQECIQDCKNANIPIREHLIFKIAPSNKMIGRYGYAFCIKNFSKRNFEIGINPKLLSEDYPLETLKQTITHILLHTCLMCWGHTELWQKYVQIIQEKYKYNYRFVTLPILEISISTKNKILSYLRK